MVDALVKGELVQWARERAALSVEALAKKVGTTEGRVRAWEADERRPTFRQAQKIAASTYVPFGYLFLSDAPDDEVPIPDLRTIDSERREELDANFVDLIHDTLFKHDWYRDHLIEQGATELPFVGRYSEQSDAVEVARDIRRTLAIDGADRPRTANWEEFLDILMERSERSGIWVMRSGVVGSNTRRTLDVAQCRGFAISDPILPLVFINGRDAKAAQIFTLAHELAHIWLGQSGVSNPGLGLRLDASVPQIERLCNQVAAEVLVPATDLHDRWDANADLAANAETLAREFKVSQVVIARRAFDLGRAEWEVYNAFFEEERERWQRDRDAGSSGGNYYNTLPVRNGRMFTDAVVSSAVKGDLLFRDAARLLNTKPNTIVEMHRRRSATR